MAHDDTYGDGYVPSEWNYVDSDDDPVSSLPMSASGYGSYLPDDQGDEVDFEYSAFIESLNDLRATSPDTFEESPSSLGALDTSTTGDITGHAFYSHSEEFDTQFKDTGDSIWDTYSAVSNEQGSEPYNSEAYTAMTALDSGYAVPYSPSRHLLDDAQSSDPAGNSLSSGGYFDRSKESEDYVDSTVGKHHADTDYPGSTRFPVSRFTTSSASETPPDSDGELQLDNDDPQRIAVHSSMQLRPKNSSGSGLAERVLPKSSVAPQSALSSVVVDRSSRRGGRHAQARFRVLPSSQRLRQVSAEFIARIKPNQQESTPGSNHESQNSSKEYADPFMTSTAWILCALMGLLNMGYWHLRQLGNDWASLWIAGLMVRNDQIDAIYDRAWWDFGSTASPLWSYYRDAFNISPWPHPFVQSPLVAQCVGFLSQFMNYYWSLHLLAFFTGVAIVFTVVSAHYIWKKRPLDKRYLVIIVVLLWISQPVVDASYLGQTTPILFALLLFGIAVSEHHPYASGIALAAATLIKLTPFVVVIILLFFVSRRRAAVSALVAILLTTVISVALIGPRIYATWFQEIKEISSQALVTSNNYALLSLAYADRASDLHSVTTISHPAPSIKILAIALGGLLAFGVFAAASQFRERACEVLSVGVFVSVLITNNIFWSHYTFIVIVLYVAIFFECTSAQKYIWPIAMTPIVFFYPPISGNVDISWRGSAFWATILLLVLFCVAICWEAQKRSNTKWTPGLFFRNMTDFTRTLISTGTSGTAIQMRS